jgi:hypothetical protein
MLLVYVDDTLVISHDPKPTMDTIVAMYCVKDDNVGPPDWYLSATIMSHQHANKKVWSMSAKSYIGMAVKNIESNLLSKGRPWFST